MTIYIVDIEAVDTRYTKQWKEYLPIQLRKATKEEVIDLLGEPVLSELYYNVDEFHYFKSGRFKDAYVVLFFIDNKLISKEQFLGNMIIDDIKNVKHIGNCASFIKNQDYKIPTEVQVILDQNN